MAKQQIIVSYKFNDVSSADQDLIKDIVQKNLEWKLDSYFKKIFDGKPDAQARIDYTIKFHEQTKKYDADFVFAYDGHEFVYKKEWFKILTDLVNHAFQHFKERLSKK